MAAAMWLGEGDVVYEEEIARSPFSVTAWSAYITAKAKAPAKVRNMLHERALKVLPGSYKLWHHYLTDRRAQLRGRCIDEPCFEAVNDTYERALVFMHKMPKIWCDYCEFLVSQRRATRCRRLFDRALQSLPITQHDRVWPMYLKFVRSLAGAGCWETAVRVYRRYLQYEPSDREDYIDYLKQIGHWDEASQQLGMVVSDEKFTTTSGKSKHKLWIELCTIMSKHPEAIKTLNVDAVMRQGLRKFSDQTGRLWCALANYYIRRGRTDGAQFERARDIYEEALEAVVTVRDFSMIFEAYTKFEERMLAAKMELAEAEEGGGEEDDLAEDTNDVDLRLARLERLLDRRPVLLSSVLLRQNPHNVHEWHKRVQLFVDDPGKTLRTFAEAVATVDAEKAIGQPHTLWVAFAKYYEEHGDIDNARAIYDRAQQSSFRGVDDLASIHCERAEMELRAENYDQALQVMQRATQPGGWGPPGTAAPPRGAAGLPKGAGSSKGANGRPSSSVQERLHRSTKAWAFYVDLEESLGTVTTTKAAYERCLDIKVASAQMVLNFAAFLEEHKYFEDSFKAYERGIALFGFPHVLEIWKAYLTKFVARYKGTKLERARDLFEQCLASKVPEEHIKTFFMMYADLEERYGLMRRAMAVYDRSTRAIAQGDRQAMFQLYAKKVEEHYGVTKTREIYERSIEELTDTGARDMCVQYADMERKLGEVDRARAVLSHGSQFADPKICAGYWKSWNDFEIQHGNQDTFREMLRIKRSVQAKFSQSNYVAEQLLTASKEQRAAAEDGTATGTGDALLESLEGGAIAKAEREQQSNGGPGGANGEQAEHGRPGPSMYSLEEEAAQLMATVNSNGTETSATGSAAWGTDAAPANPEDIDIDDDDEEENEDVDGSVQVTQRAVPAAVFGAAADVAADMAKAASGKKRAVSEESNDDAPEAKMGAMERFKKQRKR